MGEKQVSCIGRLGGWGGVGWVGGGEGGVVGSCFQGALPSSGEESPGAPQALGRSRARQATHVYGTRPYENGGWVRQYVF